VEVPADRFARKIRAIWNVISRARSGWYTTRSATPHIIITYDTKEKFVSTQVIINLPVADLPKSIAFFEAIGFSHNPQSTDDTGACIVVSDTILVMLLTHARFRDFTPKAICDTSKAAEVLLTLSCESREQVDGLVAKAVAAGGSTYDKSEDYGFMYTHSFVDPDGHGWGLVHMSAMPAQEWLVWFKYEDHAASLFIQANAASRRGFIQALYAMWMANVGRFRSRMGGNDMALKRMDNVGIVVESLDTAIAFFAELGLTLEGQATIEGEWAGRVTGLGLQRVEIAMMVTPDGHSRLELSRFLTPPAVADHRNAPVNALGYLRVMFTVDDIDETLARLQKRGAQLVGEVVQYEDAYRLCYIRGPEGLLIGLAEQLG
jgi:predicted lactoylglutathione lyase/catechol 2,3-dioxygenase-like lactoylglutathione lyase family enzyme